MKHESPFDPLLVEAFNRMPKTFSSTQFGRTVRSLGYDKPSRVIQSFLVTRTEKRTLNSRTYVKLKATPKRDDLIVEKKYHKDNAAFANNAEEDLTDGLIEAAVQLLKKKWLQGF